MGILLGTYDSLLEYTASLHPVLRSHVLHWANYLTRVRSINQFYR